MTTQNATAEVQVNNSPQAVIDYIAIIENRPSYLPSLKSVTNITGDSVGASWTWCWSCWELTSRERPRAHSTKRDNHTPSKPRAVLKVLLPTRLKRMVQEPS